MCERWGVGEKARLSLVKSHPHTLQGAGGVGMAKVGAVFDLAPGLHLIAHGALYEATFGLCTGTLLRLL